MKIKTMERSVCNALQTSPATSLLSPRSTQPSIPSG